MPTRRELAEAASYRRQLLSVALRGGTPGLEGVDAPERPNRSLYAGIAVAALALLAAAAHGYVAGAPAGWRSNGSFVVDRQFGGRYLVKGGELHPVTNLTSLLLLTDGKPPDSKVVDDSTLRTAATGTPLGITGVPDQPPQVRPGTPLSACASNGSLTLVVGATTGRSLRQSAVIVRTGHTFRLVSGRTGYRASERALTALGYATTQAVTVPAHWVDLLRAGPDLRLLSPPGGHARAHTSGRQAVRTPGTVVQDTSTNAEYVVTGSGLRPVLNRTSRLLLAGHPARRVSHSVIVGRPVRGPFGLRGVPASPPVVPAAGVAATPCLRPAGDLTLFSDVPAPSGDTVQTPLPGTAPTATAAAVDAPPGQGLLLAVPAQSTAVDTSPTLWLLADDAAFRLADETVAGALGYDSRRALTVPAAWLDLVGHGRTVPDLQSGS